MKKAYLFGNLLTKCLAALLIGVITFGGLWIVASSDTPSVAYASDEEVIDDMEVTSEPEETTETTDATDVVENVKTRYVKADKLKIYKKKSTSSKVLKKIKQNTEVYMYPDTISNGWVKIECKDGTEGFVQKKYLIKAKITVESLTEQAKVDAKKIERAFKAAGWKKRTGYYGPEVFESSVSIWDVILNYEYEQNNYRIHVGADLVVDGVITYEAFYANLNTGSVTDIYSASLKKLLSLSKSIKPDLKAASSDGASPCSSAWTILYIWRLPEK